MSVRYITVVMEFVFNLVGACAGSIFISYGLDWSVEMEIRSSSPAIW